MDFCSKNNSVNLCQDCYIHKVKRRSKISFIVAASLAWWLIFEIDIGPNILLKFCKTKGKEKTFTQDYAIFKTSSFKQQEHLVTYGRTNILQSEILLQY
jgi:hypothetical protein